MREKSIRTILAELRVAKATRKKEIIRESMSDTLKEVFRAALTPLYSYQVSKAPTDLLENRPRRPLLDVLNDLEFVRDRSITGNACRAYIQELHDSLEEDDRFVFRHVIEKDLRCGVQATTVNNALGYSAIPTYTVSKCMAYTQEAIQKFSYPCIAQEKLDGARVCFSKEGGSVTALSGNGRKFVGLQELEEKIQNLPVGDCVFDGELTVYQGDTILTRKQGNGILNKSIRGTITDYEASHIVVTLFDMIPVADVKKKYSNRSYLRRWTQLRSIVQESGDLHVRLPITKTVANSAEANTFYATQLRCGKEGAVLKTHDGIWEPKRLSTMVKMKVQDAVELTVVAVVEGEGKHMSALGAFLCTTKDGALLVHVGTGFSDEQRISYYTNDMIGSIVTVQANDYITRSDSDTYSLYLPTFVEIRYDKEEADSLQSVIDGFDIIYGRNNG